MSTSIRSSRRLTRRRELRSRRGCNRRPPRSPDAARTSTTRSESSRSSSIPERACSRRSTRSRPRFAALVANTGTFFNALSARQGELSGLITAANNLFQTTAQRNQQLADVFRALPNFELQTRLTLPALTRFAQAGRSGRSRARADRHRANGDPWNHRQARRRSSTALFDRLGPTVTASERGLPALDRILGADPAAARRVPAVLRNANPIVSYIGLYKREITGFFANVTGASQAHDVELPRTLQRGSLPAHLADADARGSCLPRSPPGARA